MPSLEGVGLALLLSSLLAATAWRLRRPGVVACLLLVTLALPLKVTAVDVLVPKTFSNRSVANAEQVNATLLMESGASASAAVPNQFFHTAPQPMRRR